VAARGPPVGEQHVAGREIQGLSSAPTMEESEEFKEAVSDTEFEEIAPSSADSRGATAATAASPNLT